MSFMLQGFQWELQGKLQVRHTSRNISLRHPSTLARDLVVLALMMSNCMCSFDGEVKIKAISIIGGPEGTSPGCVQL
jgi:hypothetical protein